MQQKISEVFHFSRRYDGDEMNLLMQFEITSIEIFQRMGTLFAANMNCYSNHKKNPAQPQMVEFAD